MAVPSSDEPPKIASRVYLSSPKALITLNPDSKLFRAQAKQLAAIITAINTIQEQREKKATRLENRHDALIRRIRALEDEQEALEKRFTALEDARTERLIMLEGDDDALRR